MAAMRIQNFGRNISLDVENFCQPRSTEELLQFLNDHRNHCIRCIGRLHSWSDVIRGDDAIVDMRHFQAMSLVESDSGQVVRVGAGCQLKQVVAFLNQHGLSLPTLGLIDEQSVAGAISTGTHGSGRHSISHYVQGVRVASFDPASGDATIKRVTVEDMDELRAARCSLGCLGVIVEVDLSIRKQYQIEEHFRRYETLDGVLSAEETHDLQQFYFVPWRWDFFAQHRRETGSPRSWHAWLYRLFWFLAMDRLMHLWVIPLARWLPTWATKLSFKQIIPRLIPLNWKVIDRSDRQLTMQHELFRHIEVEVFVPTRYLAQSLDCARELLVRYAGKRGRERYVHHYPICIRRVLPDDTLVSPASSLPDQDNEEAWYTISFISYVHPGRRSSFEKFAAELIEVTMGKFPARPHWGKFCTVNRDVIQRAYPNWDKFCEIIVKNDRHGRFVNPWLKSLTTETFEALPR